MSWLTGKLWQAVSAALVVALIVLGVNHFMLSHELTKTAQSLKDEQTLNAELRASIKEQNAAIDKLTLMKEEADKRAKLAQELAQINGKRFDAALSKIQNPKAVTCQEAMPIVSQTLKELRK